MNNGWLIKTCREELLEIWGKLDSLQMESYTNLKTKEADYISMELFKIKEHVTKLTDTLAEYYNQEGLNSCQETKNVIFQNQG